MILTIPCRVYCQWLSELRARVHRGIYYFPGNMNTRTLYPYCTFNGIGFEIRLFWELGPFLLLIIFQGQCKIVTSILQDVIELNPLNSHHDERAKLDKLDLLCSRESYHSSKFIMGGTTLFTLLTMPSESVSSVCISLALHLNTSSHKLQVL